MLKLGRKFCVLKTLNDEEFEAALEECIMKIKWDMMGDEGKEDSGVEIWRWKSYLGVRYVTKLMMRRMRSWN